MINYGHKKYGHGFTLNLFEDLFPDFQCPSSQESLTQKNGPVERQYNVWFNSITEALRDPAKHLSAIITDSGKRLAIVIKAPKTAFQIGTHAGTRILELAKNKLTNSLRHSSYTVRFDPMIAKSDPDFFYIALMPAEPHVEEILGPREFEEFSLSSVIESLRDTFAEQVQLVAKALEEFSKNPTASFNGDHLKMRVQSESTLLPHVLAWGCHKLEEAGWVLDEHPPVFLEGEGYIFTIFPE